MMALVQGAHVEIEVSGPNEAEQLQNVIDLFEYEYDFPQT